ncbi:hypothetical protein BX666DRAFT_173243 [Dichotomocladium elegans]|nr:hypothetical protein BX666DRAFT_173243 [Dichotomocladium elegans]
MRTTLFVAGFGSRTRARDLAYEFERYGRLVRCDIPAPKSFSSRPYAFVEFEDPRDAADAFNEMHGRRIDGYTISVQYARNAPSASWRFDRTSPRRPRSPTPPPRRYSRSYGRSRSPYYRGGRSPSPPRGRSPPPYDRRYGSRSRSPIRRPADYPPPPAGGDLPPRSRSRSPAPPPPAAAAADYPPRRGDSRSPPPRSPPHRSRSP